MKILKKAFLPLNSFFWIFSIVFFLILIALFVFHFFYSDKAVVLQTCPCWFILLRTSLFVLLLVFMVAAGVYFFKVVLEIENHRMENDKKLKDEREIFNRNMDLRILDIKFNALNRMAETIQKGSNTKELEDLEKILNNLLKEPEKE